MHKLIAVMLAFVALASTTNSLAQQYPARAVKVVVAQPPGGTTDITARILAHSLSARWKESVIVENRPGAGGNIGSEVVAKAAPDGYTIMLSPLAQHTINPWLYSGLPFDPIKSFAPVAMVGITPMVLAVKPTLSVKNVGQYIALARAQPKKVTYSSAGNGTYNHLAGESLAIAAKIELVHVPYKGVAPAISDVVGGHVDSTIGTVPSIQPYLEQGKLHALAVTTAKRSKALPDVPTLAESGLPGYDIAVRIAIFVPIGTPTDVIARISADIGKTLEIEEVVSALAKVGLEVDFGSPEKLREAVESEAADWGRTIKQLGIKLN